MKINLTYKITLLLIISSAIIVLCSWNYSNKEDKKMDEELNSFITTHNQTLKPLHKELHESYFTAMISGKKEDFEHITQLELKLSKIFADKEKYLTLKRIKESNQIDDPLLKRELKVIYHDFEQKQINEDLIKEMIKISMDIEHRFSVYRATIGEDTLTDNAVEKILSESVDNAKLQAVWEASKKVGEAVAPDVLKIVKLRNQSATELGYENFHQMMLQIGDQDPEEISQLFDQLDRLTRGTFAILKKEIDSYLAKRADVEIEELMPWHYQNRFFQEAPKIYDVDLNSYYQDQDLVKITTNYYNSIGIDISGIIENSDLYEKPGKNQHAFCTHIDREGDVRVLCNVKPNQMWMNTMLHEFGHGIYDLYIDKDLPFSLREPAHTFTTEAIAMMFGRLSSNPKWIQEMAGISNNEKDKIAEACHKSFKLEQLVFSRWAQVMYRFEKSMYEDPDQDLNVLWWDLVEKYQMIKRPPNRNRADWASKIHVATAPCYYHNYLLGELLASQLHYHISEKIIGSNDFLHESYTNQKAVGKFLINEIFIPGNKYHWNTMIENATGEKLTAKYYALQFVK